MRLGSAFDFLLDLADRAFVDRQEHGEHLVGCHLDRPRDMRAVAFGRDGQRCEVLEIGAHWRLDHAVADDAVLVVERTELFFDFFKSFSDKALCNLNIKAEGTIEHHKIEAIFKAFAKAIKMAVRREGSSLPTTKGVL